MSTGNTDLYELCGSKLKSTLMWQTFSFLHVLIPRLIFHITQDDWLSRPFLEAMILSGLTCLLYESFIFYYILWVWSGVDDSYVRTKAPCLTESCLLKTVCMRVHACVCIHMSGHACDFYFAWLLCDNRFSWIITCWLEEHMQVPPASFIMSITCQRLLHY